MLIISSDISNNSALKIEQHGIVKFQKYLLPKDLDFAIFSQLPKFLRTHCTNVSKVTL